MLKFFNTKNKKKFLDQGYVFLENVLSKNKVNEIKKTVYELLEYENKIGKAYIYKFDKSKKTSRIWNLINKHKTFRDIIQHKEINLFMNWIFDRKTIHQKYYLSSFQANILKPGALSQRLHIDTPVPEPLPDWPIKANTIWMIDEFTKDNGATEILPKSHKKKFKPKAKDNNNKNIIKCLGKPGSVLITHGALWHRAGANKSKLNRVGLLGSFAASYAREIANEEDQSRIIDKFTKRKMSNFLKKIVGIDHGIKNGAFVVPKNRT